MNDDERLNLYFEQQAAHVSLPDGDARQIVAAADRRRRARRSISGVAAVLVLALGVAGLYAAKPQTQLDALDAPSGPGSTTQARVAGPLTWSTVDVPAGLGWSNTSVMGDDGSLYGLSTAPGRPKNDADWSPSTLYRSTDGRAWSAVSLPAELWPTSLATSPGHLYAFGTAPSGGGGIELVVATSTDQAATWTEVRLPSPAAALQARFGDEVRVSNPRLSTGPSGVVAAVSVSVIPDARRLLAAKGIAYEAFLPKPTGVDLYKLDGVDCGVQSGTVPPPPVVDPSGAAPSATPAPTVAPSVPGTTPGTAVATPCGRGPAVIERSMTWVELGLEPELLELIDVRVHVYTSSDGVAFTEVSSPVLDSLHGHVAGLIGSADGYRMLLASGRDDVVHQAFSPDGTNWTSTGTSQGWVQSVGLLDGVPVVAVGGMEATQLLIATVGGGWRGVDVAAALRAQGVPTPQTFDFQDVAFGPLGLIGYVSVDGNQATSMLIESSNGTTFTVRNLTELTGPGTWTVMGITVSADAVIVRLSAGLEPNEDPQTAPIKPQRLVVGTPS